MYIVLTATPSAEEAEKLAREIVAEKLAACVQILPQVKSVYFWDGAIQTNDEHLLLIKTLPEKFSPLKRFISDNHSYDAPEIVALESSDAGEKYAAWLEDYLR